MYSFDYLTNKIMPLNDIELFYKKYYMAKKNPDTFNQFLLEIDVNSFPANVLYIPELNNKKYDMYTEQWAFENVQNENIKVFSHARYTPAFKHAHDFFEIIYVWKGFCKNRIENQDFLMNEDDFCILAPGTMHSLDVIGDNNIVVNILIKKSTFLETFYKILSIDNLVSTFFNTLLYNYKSMSYILFHPHGDEQFKSIMNYLVYEQYLTDEAASISKESLLITAFVVLLRYHSDTAEYLRPRNIDFSGVTDIIRYIESNYKDARLVDMAKHFNYASPYLSKIIKDATGMTFTEIRANIRQRKACALLVNTDISMQEISDSVGFKNPEQFFKFFKQRNGITPNEYRNRYR